MHICIYIHNIYICICKLYAHIYNAWMCNVYVNVCMHVLYIVYGKHMQIYIMYVENATEGFSRTKPRQRALVLVQSRWGAGWGPRKKFFACARQNAGKCVHFKFRAIMAECYDKGLSADFRRNFLYKCVKNAAKCTLLPLDYSSRRSFSARNFLRIISAKKQEIVAFSAECTT